MLDSRLNKTIGRELENLNRAKNKQVILAAAIILLILAGIYFLKPTITGFIVVEKQFNYSDSISLTFEESSEYVWIPEHQGTLSSLKLSGSYKTEGNVKVYLEDEENMYLVFDSSKLNESGITGITGLAVSNETKDEDSLKKIAEQTSGKYFRAESTDVLKNAFKEIASFTKKRISFDMSWFLLIVALSLLALEWILIHTAYKTIP